MQEFEKKRSLDSLKFEVTLPKFKGFRVRFYEYRCSMEGIQIENLEKFKSTKRDSR
jgi:hypothetical protein